ncbi:HAD family hydrolase [Paratissierella segnis]|jgi:phosphoglycolate phosphatase|uniref:HAD family hydrolase n=1 Tax=Paratissierella segnis TaxID=2763679 RepID=A0A926F053_9FIRM|nr:HAD family hydrolase [Paratissierella segnis]MBC8589479.1 HAD family hydrolase [Paratissierella segnis]
MNKYKGIIFDLDGTLLNTIEDISDSVNEVLRVFNCPEHNYDDYKLKLGSGFKSLLENSFPEGTDEETILKGLDLFVKIYDKKFKNKTKPYEGISELLYELNKLGIKIGVNSNKRNDYTNELIKKFFEDISFVDIFGEREGIPKKPDPTTVLEISKHMELSLSEIVYIGDSKIDMMTATNAHIDSIGVLWGFRSLDELVKYNATYIVSEPKEILDIISKED